MGKIVYSVDCGGTNLRVAAVNEKLDIVSFKRIPTIKDNPQKLYEAMKDMLLEVSKEVGVEIKDIGVSICGMVENNKVGKCGNIGIVSGFDFEALFKKDFPHARLVIANDANCSAYVEGKFGANKGLDNSIFVTISSGIGAGVIHKGEMIDLPIEAGRLMINFQDKIYEAEYLLSGNGIVRLAKLYGLDVIDAANFFKLVEEKDRKILPVYEKWLAMLGMWFANLQLMFDAKQYALSGGVLKSGYIFLEDLQKIANAYIVNWGLNPIILKDAKFKQDVGTIAAASLVL